MKNRTDSNTELLRTRLEKLGDLREQIIAPYLNQDLFPNRKVFTDQIVWSRSPVRIDLAGGWSDTPPYSLIHGGRVVNLAVNVNGQEPLQVFVKPTKNRHIVLRSIDAGLDERVSTLEELSSFNKIGSPFSIPKAALSLCGLSPAFNNYKFGSLTEYLNRLGYGIELTMLSCIPAGSGLGTSSLLGSACLGALSNFFGFEWSTNEIAQRTLALEQLLTTGGGWQDQFGGMYGGIKIIESEPALIQNPHTTRLPETIFMSEEYEPCHMLYYTGITRTAKNILIEIVNRMFIQDRETLGILEDIKEHTFAVERAIIKGDLKEYGPLLKQSWKLNKELDPGVSTPEIEYLISKIDDWALGYKLPGAGGGGYLYMVAKDPEAAERIKKALDNDTLRKNNARLGKMTLSLKGLQVTSS
ncbi:MAG: hypothetical protein Q3998_04170 [Porphyromonas sp.]|nr:hypothetical protein [Porphyromonas sp.]